MKRVFGNPKVCFIFVCLGSRGDCAKPNPCSWRRHATPASPVGGCDQSCVSSAAVMRMESGESWEDAHSVDVVTVLDLFIV